VAMLFKKSCCAAQKALLALLLVKATA